MRYIYLYQNIINLKIYVGQTKDMRARQAQHKCDALRNDDMPIHRAIKKYGLQNFEITVLEIVEDIDADEAESFYIQFFNSRNKSLGYNISSGGCNIKQHAQETKDKISAANKGKIHNTPEHMEKLWKLNSINNKGRKLTQETKDKISKSHIGKTVSNESKAKMSKTRIERGTFAKEKNPMFGKIGELNPSAKLTWEIVRNIRKDYANDIKGKQLMEKYNISETNMYRIIKNKIWKE